MKRELTAVLFLVLLAPPAQALTLSPEIVFTVRDEIPVGGSPDFISVDPGGGFTGFVTNDVFVDETFIEFALGDTSADSAILNLHLYHVDPVALQKTVDVSAYGNGNGSAQLGLFGTGDFFQSVLVAEFFTLNIVSLNVLSLYNDAVAAGDDYLGFRLHSVVNLNPGNAQVFNSTGTSLVLSEVPLPAAFWLFAGALAGLAGFGWRGRRS